MQAAGKIRSRNYALDFVKAAATVCLFLHHYQQVTGARFAKPWINFYGGRLYTAILVEFFFLLSGFFMYGYVERIYRGEVSFARFYLHRVSRLLPMVSVTAAAYALITNYLLLPAVRKSDFYTFCNSLSES